MSTASGHPGGPAGIEIGVGRDGGSKMVRLGGWTPGKRFAAGHVGHHPSVARTAVPCCAIGNSAPERPEVRSSRSRHLHFEPLQTACVPRDQMTMMATYNNPAYLAAFERLLARPDPKDLPRRAHALRWEGEPNRRSTRLVPIVMGWLQRRFLEVDIEEPLAPAIRTREKRRARVTTPGPRLLRPTGTE